MHARLRPRGGGGNFGVVTSLELCLHPVGSTVLAGQFVHPRERAGARRAPSCSPWSAT